MKKILVLIILLLTIFMIGCFRGEENNQDPRGFQPGGEVTPKSIQREFDLTEDGRIVPEQAKEAIEDTSDKVIRAIRDKDFETLAKFVHPEKGVRFTPYTYVSTESDIVFTRDQVRNFFKDEKEYLWGHFDGTGDEIRMTPRRYYERFIYSNDFVNAEQIGYNEVLSFGNMLENQFEVYDRPIIVEYYFPGFNPDYGGMDWRSLRLVFEEHEGSWYLVGIIHNEWTT